MVMLAPHSGRVVLLHSFVARPLTRAPVPSALSVALTRTFVPAFAVWPTQLLWSG